MSGDETASLAAGRIVTVRMWPMSLGDRLGPRLVDSAVITTGREAYRRADGVGVTPASLLGP
ncbi:MAG: hypothetical protein F4033_14445 [Acidimicrobiaceae bacterium]|nr:hypothetical protein [Acidimicrobiaceae bacterium]MYF33873.1 hypothetical protein [Acidimicrobiaceae bacterium]MYG80238.1 hypothetical protein [Acidimicrobiaceae bacterium]MYJ85379.1 hypothetical protein [Acidimicrobiaceae bacterium]